MSLRFANFYIVLLLCCAHQNNADQISDPTYDHQKTVYKVSFQPSTQTANVQMTSFFSPDYSAGSIVDFIASAISSIDIMTPGYGSWDNCTNFNLPSGCVGCTVEKCSSETFPVFQALLNAVHRGVVVRVLTNDYGTPTCASEISPLDFLSLAGVEIRYYTSTTFVHAKYMSKDGTDVSVSSVNWTWNSYMCDREAGLILNGTDATPFIKFATSVFDTDWAAALPYKVSQTYKKTDMDIITNPKIRQVIIPAGPDRPYVSPKPRVIQAITPVTMTTSPDYSYEALEADLNKVTTSLSVFIYQVTDPRLCDQLLALSKKGINVSLLVSENIYDETDASLAAACYKKLHAEKFPIQVAKAFYKTMFSHQKFWILDETSVGLSTGNWSPSDYPGGAASFPPYPNPLWRDTNRDYTITVANPVMVQIFQDVFNNDFATGFPWKPSK